MSHVESSNHSKCTTIPEQFARLTYNEVKYISPFPAGPFCCLWLRPRFCHHHCPLRHAPRGESGSTLCYAVTLVRYLSCTLNSYALTPYDGEAFMFTNVTPVFRSTQSHSVTRADQTRISTAFMSCVAALLLHNALDSTALSIWSQAALRSLLRCCMEGDDKSLTNTALLCLPLAPLHPRGCWILKSLSTYRAAHIFMPLR